MRKVRLFSVLSLILLPSGVAFAKCEWQKELKDKSYHTTLVLSKLVVCQKGDVLLTQKPALYHVETKPRKYSNTLFIGHGVPYSGTGQRGYYANTKDETSIYCGGGNWVDLRKSSFDPDETTLTAPPNWDKWSLYGCGY